MHYRRENLLLLLVADQLELQCPHRFTLNIGLLERERNQRCQNQHHKHCDHRFDRYLQRLGVRRQLSGTSFSEYLGYCGFTNLHSELFANNYEPKPAVIRNQLAEYWNAALYSQDIQFGLYGFDVDWSCNEYFFE